MLNIEDLETLLKGPMSCHNQQEASNKEAIRQTSY